jgi:hypothetical protein
MSHALTLAEFKAALRHSVALLSARPLKWLAITVVFLIAVESLMFIPFIGFLVKLSVAGLLVAQWMRMFVDVDAGHAPRLRTFVDALALPWSAQWILVVAAITPFLIGIVFLAATGGGWQGAAFFFGHMAKEAAPDAGRFFVFKFVMALVSTLFAFVAGAVVLRGMAGIPALTLALRAAAQNWRVMLFFLATGTAFEGLQATLSALPIPLVAIAIALATLPVYLAWTIAFSYALSVRALAARSGQPEAPPAVYGSADAG